MTRATPAPCNACMQLPGASPQPHGPPPQVPRTWGVQGSPRRPDPGQRRPRLRGRAGPGPPPAQSRVGRSLGGIGPPPAQSRAGRRLGGIGPPPCLVTGWEAHQGDWPTPPPSHGLGVGSGGLAHPPGPRPVTGWAHRGGIRPPPAQSMAGRSLGGLAHPRPVTGCIGTHSHSHGHMEIIFSLHECHPRHLFMF
jgi:hypothetical protein